MTKLYNQFIIFIYRYLAQIQFTKFLQTLDEPLKYQDQLRKQLERDYMKSKRFKRSGLAFNDLPITKYNDLAAHGIEEIVSNKILFFEETSGSSGIKKRIPYTNKLMRSFRLMFLYWSCDILNHVSFNSYKFYFSISPQFGDNEQGLNDDSSYLGRFLNLFASSFFVRLPDAKSIQDPDEFLLKLSLILVSNRELEIVSIWSPSFFLSILEYIQMHEEKFRHVLAQGKYKDLTFKKTLIANTSINNLFPSLKFISCWGSASAKSSYQELTHRFPEVFIQKKGLLATEAPMTIPLVEADGCVPLVSEVLFEFLTEDGKLLNIAEIEEGKKYELVISQKAGLLRYAINDIVMVQGFYKKTPILDFVGRKSDVSDLVGEKLHETDVERVLTKVGAFALIPSERDQCYIVLTDKDFDERKLEAIEKGLRANIHYKNSRMLNQLKRLRLFKYDYPEKLKMDYYINILGIKRGDIKEKYLLYRKADELLKKIS